MAKTRPADPISAYRFTVNCSKIPGSIGFQKISGAKESSEVIEYREGNMDPWPIKIPGMMKFEPVTFERGMTGAMTAASWRALVAACGDFRAAIRVNVLPCGGTGISQASFTLKYAWPSEAQFGDLDATGNNVLIEKMTIVYEGIDWNVG